MITFISKKLPLLLFGLTLSFYLSAQPGEYPGSLDFDSIPQVSGKDPDVEITLYGPILKLITQLPAQSLGGEDNAEMLRAIDQVLVRVYSDIPNEAENILSQMTETSSTLLDEGWLRVLRAREDDDSVVDMLLKIADDGENLNGVVIMVLEGQGEDSELVFVNIAGNFNPAYLANLSEQFDLDILDEVEMP